ncbi:T9SS type A sorting domain-containing protein, partial [bacterium]|nr:T9SS type A sorting domain-containing protein [bacterium]
ARGVLTKDWKYITVRYDNVTQKKIDDGFKFPSFINGETMTYPYYVRNSSLGYYGALHNPHYFESNQLFNMKSDPTELVNIFDTNRAVTDDLKAKLTSTLKTFSGRPYGEFFDGTTSAVSNKINENTEIKIYPNPSKGFFQIENPETSRNSRYEVYSFDGKLLLSEMIISKKTNVCLKGYPAGNYLIKVYNLNIVLTENLILM